MPYRDELDVLNAIYQHLIRKPESRISSAAGGFSGRLRPRLATITKTRGGGKRAITKDKNA